MGDMFRICLPMFLFEVILIEIVFFIIVFSRIIYQVLFEGKLKVFFNFF